MQPKVLAFGHSHLVAVADAYREPGVAESLPFRLSLQQLQRAGRQPIVKVDGRNQYHPEIIEEVITAVRTQAPDIVVLMLEGSQPALLGFARPVRPWNFMLTDDTRPPAGEIDLLPFDLVTEIARRHFSLTAAFLDRIRGELGPRVVGLSPPPPCGDDTLVLQRISESAMLRNAVLETGLAPREWRRRIWVITVGALAETLMTRGIAFLPPPPGGVDHEGFLPPALLSDALHGTAEYGRMLLTQLKEWIEG